MARSIRIQYPGAFYHVMARGNRREAIFLDDDDRRFFLKALGEACEKTGWKVHAWVLMRNHYHLLIETPQANLVAGMQWLQNTFTRRFNVRHRAWGRLFGDRYKAVLVEGGQGYYYETLVDYIHLNPIRAGIVSTGRRQGVTDFAWSSAAQGYALSPGKRASWLAASDGLAAFGFPDTASGRRRFVERLNRRAVECEAERAGIPVLDEEVDERCSHLRRGWYWGSQEFAEQLLALATTDPKPKGRAYRSGGMHRATDEKQAEQWMRDGLVAAGLTEAELEELPGSDARKVALARLLWQQTTLPQSWIAERLRMGQAANVSQQLRRSAREQTNLPKALRRFLDRQTVHI